MPVPEFVAALRDHVGHAPLWLPGVSAVVVDDTGRLLLTKRADNGKWAVVSGILEPGEEPGPAALREVREETGIDAELVRVSSVDTAGPITYPNGDVASYLDVCFVARAVAVRLAWPTTRTSTCAGSPPTPCPRISPIRRGGGSRPPSETTSAPGSRGTDPSPTQPCAVSHRPMTLPSGSRK